MSGPLGRGFSPIKAKSAMYMMIQIRLDEFPEIESDEVFAKKLLKEESVVVLPGSCFHAKGMFRITFCSLESQLKEALPESNPLRNVTAPANKPV